MTKDKKEKKKKSNKKMIIDQIKSHKKTFIAYVVLRLLVVITLVLQFLNGNYENVFLCILTLILFLLPSILEMRFKLNLPDTLEIIILLFIFSAEILGEIQNFYGLFTHWDTILHTINGFLCAAIGFSIIDILNRYHKLHLNLSPLFVAIVGFSFSMTIGVLWEFFEYTWDNVLYTDTQKDTLINDVYTVYLNPEGKNKVVKLEDITKTVVSTKEGDITIEGGYLDIGLNDTMGDLLVNFIGAIVFCTLGYIYVKKRKEDGFIQGFMVGFKE